MEDFRGKIAIVTGGASGIGKALAEELGKQGAKVIVADISVETTTASDGKLQTAHVDVSQADQVQAQARGSVTSVSGGEDPRDSGGEL